MRRTGWLARLSLALVFGAVLTGALVAQEQGGGGQGGGRGGQGGGRGPGGGRGFGGGMMMGGGGGGAMGVLGILRSESAQKEIGITEEEKAALTKLGEEVMGMMRPPRGGGFTPGGPPPSEEDRAKMMEEMRKNMEEATKKVTEGLDAILPPEKFDRLLGIFIQNSPMQAVLTHPAIEERIELTAEQKESIKTIGQKTMEEMRTAMQEIFASGDREGIQAKMEEFRKKSDEKYAEVLTDAQKTKLNELKGAEFKIPDSERGFGFGGPGGPGGRGNRGQGRPGRANQDNNAS